MGKAARLGNWRTVLAAAALLLAAATAWAWPPAWQPGELQYGQPRHYFGLVQGEPATLEIRVYEDGTQVKVLNGRVVYVDPDPANPCEKPWRDYGVYDEDDHFRPPSEWGAPEWGQGRSYSCQEA